ncbi:MAG TPA: ABC transporter permease [Firmicutes bacterium]|jgi:peptide/nickel transport system permease protein|nr:ABC transporter permease [Bacillota bacterium]
MALIKSVSRFIASVPIYMWLLFILLCASFVLNPLLGRDPNRTDTSEVYTPPSLAHPFGTDSSGRDVFARVIAAVKLDMGIAVGSGILAFLVGTLLGAVAGYIGSLPDTIVMRLFDVWQSIPGLLLGLLVLSVAGKGIAPLVGVIALINIPVYGRMTRAELAVQRNAAVVDSARLSGVPEWRILLVYLLPQGFSSALAYFPVQAGFAISVAAGFGFIGLGVSPPTAEWGAMIAAGISDLLFLNVWWTTLFPGAFLALTILLLYRMGDWLMRHD